MRRIWRVGVGSASTRRAGWRVGRRFERWPLLSTSQPTLQEAAALPLNSSGAPLNTRTEQPFSLVFLWEFGTSQFELSDCVTRVEAST